MLYGIVQNGLLLVGKFYGVVYFGCTVCHRDSFRALRERYYRLDTKNLTSSEIQVPRDRKGTYVPRLVPKHSRHFNDFDDAIIDLYGRGLSTREISEFIRSQYHVEVSAEFISTVTEKVNDDVRQWQGRPLDSVYPVVFFDALRINIRKDGVIKKMAVHLALGVRCDGRRDVLGMWVHENEAAAFWTSVFTELKNRGVEDILIAVTDGLKGMTQAIEAVFPQAQHQTCM